MLLAENGFLFNTVIKNNPKSETKCRFLLVGILLVAGICFVVLLNNSDDHRTGLLESELAVRSASLVVKDLADEWKLTHYENHPFEFCGRSTMSNRQLKACADHFLSLLSGDGSVKGLPSVPAFDICMRAQNDYQLKNCIWEVSNSVTPEDFIHLQLNGDMDPQRAAYLNVIAQAAVDTAIPVDAIEGVDGGLTAASAESSTSRFMKKQNAVGAYPTEGVGCVLLGMGGCEMNGGFNPEFRQEAADRVTNATVAAQLHPPPGLPPLEWVSNRESGPLRV